MSGCEEAVKCKAIVRLEMTRIGEGGEGVEADDGEDEDEDDDELERLEHSDGRRR